MALNDEDEVDLRDLIEQYDWGREDASEFQTPVSMAPDQMDGANEWGEFYDERYGPSRSGTSPGSVHYIDETGLPAYLDVKGRVRANQEIASVIEKWTQEISNTGARKSVDVFNRDRWQGASHIFAQMSLAAWAVENDDILSTLCDVVEGLMFQKCRFELFDTDQQSVWNQWAKDINLDSLLRKVQRELFKVSQVYVGLWWEEKVYSVKDDAIRSSIEELEEEREQLRAEERERARLAYIEANKGVEGFVAPPKVPQPQARSRGGNRTRRKRFPLKVPTQATVFDPLKVVPVGMLMFGRERFAYVASRGENETFSRIMQGEIADGTVLQLIERKYDPTPDERAELSSLGIDAGQLWLFKPNAVFRHTLTRADYERFAPLRLKPILEILEMKAHLRSADRAALIGQTNFLVVITKGTDKLPAKPSEIANLQEQARVIARLPVLVGDHRLNVEIVSPDLTNTLIESRHQVLDARLVFAALNTYSPVVQGGNSSGAGVSEMSRVISTGLENRRHMIVRSLEEKVFEKILERNEAVPDFQESPSLVFAPKKISLDIKAEVLNQVLKLRDRGDISRETALEELDFDQDVEVLRRARERVDYDKVFESTTPHSSPMQNPYGTPGAPPPPPGQPPPPGTPPAQQPEPAKPGSNVGPKGQPRTEGGRPPGAKDTKKRKAAGED